MFARKMSPVEMAGTPSRSQIRAACVPLPAPGGPMINMRVMLSLRGVVNVDSSLTARQHAAPV